MDPSIYVSMSAAKQQMQLQQIHAENMANVNVSGYKASRSSAQPVYLTGGDMTTRSYQEVNSHYPDMADGALNYTNRPLDFSLRGNAWVSVQIPGGTGYVHSAGLILTTEGDLVTEGGYALSDANGRPIVISGVGEPEISSSGEIFMRSPLGGLSLVSSMHIVSIDPESMIRGNSGLIEVTDAAAVRNIDTPRVLTGVLEKSNITQEKVLIDLINSKENYSANMQMFGVFKELSSTSTQVLVK